MKLVENIIDKILPSEKEEEKLKKVVNEIFEEIENRKPYDIEAMLVGSVAKGTYLKDSLDIDFFILFPKNYDKKEMEEIVISIGKEILNEWRIQYAEHPYIRGYYKGYEVDIVPCYKIKNIREMKSSVDRTPFHTQYIKKHMDQKTKNETRLLKKFLKAIGCYGAEARVEGFSGYLAELLILKYGSFLNLVKNAAQWHGKIFLTLGNASNKFEEEFVFVDPVDPSRNVAAALSKEKLQLFIKASKAFLENPSEKFFFPNPVPKMSVEEIEKKLENFIGICFEKPNLVDDVLYPQLKKAAKSMEGLFIKYNFEPIRKAWYANEEAFILIELRKIKIEKEKIHMGPPIKDKKNVQSFMKKWKNCKDAIGEPFEEDGRVWVKIRRKYTDARELLKDKLNEISLGRNIDEIKNKIRICSKEASKFVDFWSEYFCNLLPWER